MIDSRAPLQIDMVVCLISLLSTQCEYVCVYVTVKILNIHIVIYAYTHTYIRLLLYSQLSAAQNGITTI